MNWRHHFRVILSAAPLAIGAANADAAVLRVCADPNNLPFSDRAGHGFENKIVTLIAHDLGATVEYTWWAQRRGYIRHTLKADICDIWPGVASGAEMMTSTRPYYRSSYAFVTRADRGPRVTSFDDPQLRKLAIGVQMVGSDATNTPPAHALARRGVVQNVHGYMLYGDYRHPHPPSAIVDAVENGNVDVAVVWGPTAGYFAAREHFPLTVEPVQSGQDDAELPMAFDISMGVRRGDYALLQRLNDSLERNHAAIAAILAAYRVPVLPEPFAVPDPPPRQTGSNHQRIHLSSG
jgi:mxaJ protein